ncbi:Zn-dependent exopeptidase M28 [Streptomyces sp. A7024]|uniref:Zn-dependent exopeptidase M28 n=1 Tax=Streptomyces coryli TaxID=1128680 RepID=A0A6G4U8C8_9ACTN|nr:Zn-dependent exopeptidase M28 [Streptomyces coryli]NGN67980.1 Zn-dependent exopeptidase M28 [Streptomyces coryli]
MSSGQPWPDTQEMLDWIGTVTEQGIRRPGYPADSWTEDWAAGMFRSFGLETRLETVPVPRWQPGAATLYVHGRGGELRLDGFQLPYTAAAPRGHTAPLVRLEDLAGAEPGAIAVDEVELTKLDQSAVRTLATGAYDPEKAFDHLAQTLPFGPRLLEVAEPAIAAGAGGYVGALTGFPWETRDYYVPYDAVQRPVPGLWLSRGDARVMLDAMAAGPCTATLVTEGVTKRATSRNVIATLPGGNGATDHWVIIASHHDAPWASAVEDGTGIALVLAAARHWAQVPRAERPHNLLFLLTAGHMAHAAGTRAFIERHRDLLGSVVLQLHLEHAALRCEVKDGLLKPTADPEVRWWFTTQEPALEQLVLQSLQSERLRRSLVLPPDVFSPLPPTDGAFFHEEGVRLVHFLSAPPYLFDSADTLDKVDAEGLLPLSRAAARIVAGTAGWSP